MFPGPLSPRRPRVHLRSLNIQTPMSHFPNCSSPSHYGWLVAPFVGLWSNNESFWPRCAPVLFISRGGREGASAARLDGWSAPGSDCVWVSALTRAGRTGHQQGRLMGVWATCQIPSRHPSSACTPGSGHTLHPARPLEPGLACSHQVSYPFSGIMCRTFNHLVIVKTVIKNHLSVDSHDSVFMYIIKVYLRKNAQLQKLYSPSEIT